MSSLQVYALATSTCPASSICQLIDWRDPTVPAKLRDWPTRRRIYTLGLNSTDQNQDRLQLQKLTLLLRNFDAGRHTLIREVRGTDSSVIGDGCRALCYVRFRPTLQGHVGAQSLARALEMN